MLINGKFSVKYILIISFGVFKSDSAVLAKPARSQKVSLQDLTGSTNFVRGIQYEIAKLTLIQMTGLSPGLFHKRFSLLFFSFPFCLSQKIFLFYEKTLKRVAWP